MKGWIKEFREVRGYAGVELTFDGAKRFVGARETLSALHVMTLGLAKHRVNEALCKRFGHKMEDAGSYANGESAADHFHCTRCDFLINHTYY